MSKAIEVAITDVEALGVSGDAQLSDGDEVFLFLEELDNSVFKIREISPA